MKVDKLINKSELAKEFGLKRFGVTNKNRKKIEQLNAMLEFWRKQNL